MSSAELIEEARRRDERRRSGKPLAPEPVELEKRAAEVDARLEKEIQRDVIKRYKVCGCNVYNLSQPRATKQSLGLPDLYVFPPERNLNWDEGYRSFWHEVKTPNGKSSPEQLEFQIRCKLERTPYVLGGVQAAEEHCIKLKIAERINGVFEPIRR